MRFSNWLVLSEIGKLEMCLLFLYKVLSDHENADKWSRIKISFVRFAHGKDTIRNETTDYVKVSWVVYTMTHSINFHFQSTYRILKEIKTFTLSFKTTMESIHDLHLEMGLLELFLVLVGILALLISSKNLPWLLQKKFPSPTISLSLEQKQSQFNLLYFVKATLTKLFSCWFVLPPEKV